jgi:hypothetical protein
MISGTPRTNSMKITENSRTAGMCERRPSAARCRSATGDDPDRRHHDGHQHAAPRRGRNLGQADQRPAGNGISEAIGMIMTK